jgi:hypothetical protein
MFLDVLFGGEDLHELGSTAQELAQVVTVDGNGHEQLHIFFIFFWDESCVISGTRMQPGRTAT